MSRKQFQVAWRTYNRTREQYFKEIEDKEYAKKRADKEVMDLFLKLRADEGKPWKGKKPPTDKKIRDFLGSTYDEVMASASTSHQDYIDGLYAKFRDAKVSMTEAAELADPVAGESKLMLAHVSKYSYGSQGGGAESYARNAADMKVMAANYFGIKASVEKDRHGFKVYVLVDHDIDVQILRLRRVPLRESVRFCWANSMNPRVYYPTLPHGYEEQVGLDFFGNETRTSAGG